MARETCKSPSCDDQPSSDTRGGKFCSTRCEVVYDKRRDEAKEAMLADQKAAEDRAPEPRGPQPPY